MTEPDLVDFEEGQQRGIEARALEIGELVRRRHEGFGIGSAAEGEIEQRNAADRPLLDHPGDRAMQAFFKQNARHIGRDAEAEIDGASRLKFHGDTARDDFLDVEIRQREIFQWMENLAGYGRIVERLRRLLLVGIDDDVVNEDAGNAHIMRLHRAALGDAFDLRNDNAAIVAHRQRLIEAAEIGAFMLIGEIAALVRGGGANDRDLRNDRLEEQPFLAARTRSCEQPVPWRQRRSWRSPAGPGRQKYRARPW